VRQVCILALEDPNFLPSLTRVFVARWAVARTSAEGKSQEAVYCCGERRFPVFVNPRRCILFRAVDFPCLSAGNPSLALPSKASPSELTSAAGAYLGSPGFGRCDHLWPIRQGANHLHLIYPCRRQRS